MGYWDHALGFYPLVVSQPDLSKAVSSDVDKPAPSHLSEDCILYADDLKQVYKEMNYITTTQTVDLRQVIISCIAYKMTTSVRVCLPIFYNRGL